MDILDKCKREIQEVLDRNNCSLIPADMYTNILIRDNENDETCNATSR